MSTGDQIIAALIDGFFEIVVTIMIATFESIFLPILASLFGM